MMSAGCRQYRVKADLDTAFLVGFAAEQCHRIDMLVEAHHREAQVRLALIAFGIALDERPAHPIADQRGGARIDDRCPNHIARNIEAAPADIEDEAGRQGPQHADEAHKQDRRLEQADAEIGRELGQVAGVFMQALVRIHPDGARIGEPEGTAGLEPLTDKVEHQSFAQLEFRHLVQEGLENIQHQKTAGNHGEDAELDYKAVEVTARKRIIERLVPPVEQDLAIGRQQDHSNKSETQNEQGIAHARGKEGANHHRQLRH